jgi:hypothetical protein
MKVKPLMGTKCLQMIVSLLTEAEANTSRFRASKVASVIIEAQKSTESDLIFELHNYDTTHRCKSGDSEKDTKYLSMLHRYAV